MRVVYLPTADRDLLEIFEWIAASDMPAADRYVDKIRNGLWRLRDFPHSGSPREDIALGVRGIVVASHVALYRVTEASVEIVRVVHGARDMRAFAEDFA